MKKNTQRIIIQTLFVLLELGLGRVEMNQQDNTNYHLKWVGKEPLLPIFIEKFISSSSTEYRWFKYPHNVFIDEEGKNSTYLESHTQDRTILYILEYNTITHENLASYQPKPVVYDDNVQEDQTEDSTIDIYTLAYIDSHSIGVSEERDNLVAHCNVSLLLPNIFKNENLKLVERGLNLKLGFVNGRGHSHIHHHQQNKISNQQTKVRTRSLPDKTKRNSKRSNDQNIYNRKSLLQVNLDIGPILIPKSQLSTKDNPELMCKLELLENNMMVQEYQVKKSIDEVAKSLRVFPPSLLQKNQKPNSEESRQNDNKNKIDSQNIINDAKSLTTPTGFYLVSSFGLLAVYFSCL